MNLGVGSSLRVGEGRELVDVEPHEIGGVDGSPSRVGDDHCHGIPDMAHFVTGQHRPGHVVGSDATTGHRRDVLNLKVLGSEDPDNALDVGGHVDVDRRDATVRDRAAHEGAVQRVGIDQVGDIRTGPGDERPVIQPPV